MSEQSGSTQIDLIREGYAFTAPSIVLGGAVDGEAVVPDAVVRLPLGSMNRHGLVAGATGTGKTVTLQVLAEQLSDAGVPVFLADVKGDLTGLATAAGGHPKVEERMGELQQEWTGTAYPVEVFNLGGHGAGSPIRATITSFGPTLLSKVLRLNKTQESSLGLVFHWADQRGLALLDLKDLQAVIQHLVSEEGKPDLKDLLPGLRADGHRAVLVVPVQFLADHLEILYDIDIAAREEAEAAGLAFHRIELMNTSPSFIRALADVALDQVRSARQHV